MFAVQILHVWTMYMTTCIRLILFSFLYTLIALLKVILENLLFTTFYMLTHVLWFPKVMIFSFWELSRIISHLHSFIHTHTYIMHTHTTQIPAILLKQVYVTCLKTRYMLQDWILGKLIAAHIRCTYFCVALTCWSFQFSF